MAILNFSIKGESSDAQKLQSRTRRFNLELNQALHTQHGNHTTYSVAYLRRTEEYADLLNALLYKAAVAEHIIIDWLSITITGHIEELLGARGKKRENALRNIDITVEIMADAKDSQLRSILQKARAAAPSPEHIKYTSINYSINSVVHLN